MSKYLSLAANLAKKASALTEEQQKAVKALEKNIETLNKTLKIAIEAIERDVQKKQLTVAQGECEVAIAKAHTRAAIEECEAKIREINPLWVSNVVDTAKLASQALSIKGLEMVGKGLGFLGRAVDTAKAARDAANTGAFVAPKKLSILDTFTQE